MMLWVLEALPPELIEEVPLTGPGIHETRAAAQRKWKPGMMQFPMLSEAEELNGPYRIPQINW